MDSKFTTVYAAAANLRATMRQAQHPEELEALAALNRNTLFEDAQLGALYLELLKELNTGNPPKNSF